MEGAGKHKKHVKTRVPITEINNIKFEQSSASVDILAKDKRRSFYQHSINSYNNAHRELLKKYVVRCWKLY